MVLTTQKVSVGHQRFEWYRLGYSRIAAASQTVFSGVKGLSAFKPDIFFRSNIQPKPPGVLYAPIIQALAFYYTHPRWMEKALPWTSTRLPAKYLKHFQPIEKVSFNSLDKTKLQGYWLPSTQKDSKKTVILGHGYTADYTEMISMAQAFRQKGYHCFLFDFRAHGASGARKTSIGYHEAKDIASAVQTVTEKFPQQSQKLFYFGHSMGATSFLMMPASVRAFPDALKRVYDRLNGVVLDAPFYNFREITEQFVKHIGVIDQRSWLMRNVMGPLMKQGLAEKVIDGFHIKTPKYLNIPDDFFNLKPAKITAESPLVNRPILVAHGNLDATTPYHHGVRVYEELRKANPSQVSFLSMQGQDHVDREWRPFGSTKSYNRAERGNLLESAMAFFDRLAV